MDDQKPNDATDEGTGQTAVNIVVKTASDTPAGPIINDIQPPREPEVKIEDKDLDAVNTAVQGISDEPMADEKLAESPDELAVDAAEAQEDNQSEGVIEEPEVKEAPEVAETPDSQVDDKSEPAVDPFMQTETTAPLASVPATTPQSMSNNEQSLPHEHRNNKKFAVIITVVVALILAGAAVYVYLSAQNNTSESAKSNTVITSQEQVVEPIPASSADVEQAATEIDEAIKSIDDDTDLSEAAISDAALGL